MTVLKLYCIHCTNFWSKQTTSMSFIYILYKHNDKHSYKLNITIAKWFNQMVPPARTITVALDMNKAFDTINIHTLMRKLLQTNIPGTIIKFIANYIKGRKAYTIYGNHTSKQRQFNTSVSPTLFNIYTSDIHHPVHRFRSWHTQTTSQLPGQNKTTSY